MNTYQLNKFKPILLTKFNYKCAKCSSKHDLQIDHILAKSLGGNSDEENLQILCGLCNRKKGGKKSKGSPVRKNKEGMIRKDLNLGEGVICRLQQLADKKDWSLKYYMEKTLVKESQKMLKRTLAKFK